MVNKGILRYEEGEKARQYYPNVSREEAALTEAENLLEKVYHGSVSMMMSTLAQRESLSKEEVQEIKELIAAYNEIEWTIPIRWWKERMTG